MTHEPSKRILLAGYAGDLAAIVPMIRPGSTDVVLVTEEASDDDIPKAVDVVVFVASLDTCYSTRMHSLFVHVYDRVSAPQRYVLAVGNFDLAKFVFPEMRGLPRISTGELASVTATP